MQKRTSLQGVTTLMVVFFLGIFLLIVSTVASFALQEEKYAQILLAREQALNAAESALGYYRWHLAHFPTDLTNSTSTPGPYTYTVVDTQRDVVVGSARYSVYGNTQCNTVQWVDLVATGTSAQNPHFSRTVSVRYMRPSVARYSILTNSNTWEGGSETITGPFHSNGGIRMDAPHNAQVTSAVSTWVCERSLGCSPTKSKAPGVFGSSTNSKFWQYPVPSVDFTGGVALHLTTMKNAAQQYGLYFPPTAGIAGKRGYHFIFNNDGTVTVYKVTDTVTARASSNFTSFVNDYSVIKTEKYYGTFTPPSGCRVLFVEDNIWIEGTVRGQISIGVADYSNSGWIPNAYLKNSITYTAYNGNDGLTVVADGNVLIPLNSPNTLSVRGIFVARTGMIGRMFYTTNTSYGMTNVVPSAYAGYVVRDNFNLVGTMASNLQANMTWLSGTTIVSGYKVLSLSYDQLQSMAPPPFTPYASANFTFINWDER